MNSEEQIAESREYMQVAAEKILDGQYNAAIVAMWHALATIIDQTEDGVEDAIHRYHNE